MEISQTAFFSLFLIFQSVILFFLYKVSHKTAGLFDRLSEITQITHLLSTRIEDKTNQTEVRLQTLSFDIERILSGVKEQLQTSIANFKQETTEKHQQLGNQITQQLNVNLLTQSESLRQNTEQLVKMVQESLRFITTEVNKKLSDGFEKTTSTFTDIVKRIAIIDEAQKKITELSGNVVSLQEILTDKRARGAFGEVQLSALIRNMIPETHYSFQHAFSNGKRADCAIFLPEPTGTIAIDSKFPLENYQRLSNPDLPESERKSAEQQFKIDIKKHIQDIASKYIIEGETADGAILFIPAESVFAKIHAQYPDLVETAHRARIWLVSPTTLMAVLTTIRAVLKDEATRQQVHVIQQHLIMLSRDFLRFQTRMDNLSKHVNLVHADVEDIQTSAKKMTSRFQKIEKAQMDASPDESLTKTALLEEET